jgi:hypothetical protein
LEFAAAVINLPKSPVDKVLDIDIPERARDPRGR